MDGVATAISIQARLRGWTALHRARLYLSLRIVVASLVTFALAHLLGLKQSYWAVLTAVIVMQASVGGAIRASIDRLIGSVGGAVWGVAVCIAIPHTEVLSLALALAVAVAPLAVATAFNPAWRIAPVTAIILLLTPTSQAVGPVAAALQRMLEVGLGSVVAVLVAFILAPARPQATVAEEARSALAAMADLARLLLAGLSEAREPAAAEGLHAQIRRAIAAAEAAGKDARQERMISLTASNDPAPLCRALRRVHHDLVMLGRATVTPLPPTVGDRLRAPVDRVSETLTGFLAACAQEIGAGDAPRSPLAAREALDGFSAAVAGLRADGSSRALADEAVGRLFGLSFALEQTGLDLDELVARAAELTDHRRA